MPASSATAPLCAVTWDKQRQQVRLVNHRIFQPSPDHPVDFETMVEQTLLDWHGRYKLQAVFYDPYQMVASAQRLSRERLPMREFPQTSGNLTETGQGLFELIKGRNLVSYPDETIRTAISRAVAVETPRGWRIGKDKQTHKIDIVVALSMAALAAVRTPPEQKIRTWFSPALDPKRPISEVDILSQQILCNQTPNMVAEAPPRFHRAGIVTTGADWACGVSVSENSNCKNEKITFDCGSRSSIQNHWSRY
jgi:hypothetical protein